MPSTRVPPPRRNRASHDRAAEWKDDGLNLAAQTQENGKTYKAKLELLDRGRKLGMSGCIGFLCRQQVCLRL